MLITRRDGEARITPDGGEEGRGREGEGRHAYPSELNKHDGKINLSSNEALQLKQTFLATNRPLFLTITQMHALPSTTSFRK